MSFPCSQFFFIFIVLFTFQVKTLHFECIYKVSDILKIMWLFIYKLFLPRSSSITILKQKWVYTMEKLRVLTPLSLFSHLFMYSELVGRLLRHQIYSKVLCANLTSSQHKHRKLGLVHYTGILRDLADLLQTSHINLEFLWNCLSNG